jgi:hypothetical protein
MSQRQTQTPTIMLAGKTLIVSWPDTAGYILQQKHDLSTTAPWTAVTNSITSAAGTNSITITPVTGSLFFRLANP